MSKHEFAMRRLCLQNMIKGSFHFSVPLPCQILSRAWFLIVLGCSRCLKMPVGFKLHVCLEDKVVLGLLLFLHMVLFFPRDSLGTKMFRISIFRFSPPSHIVAKSPGSLLLSRVGPRPRVVVVHEMSPSPSTSFAIVLQETRIARSLAMDLCKVAIPFPSFRAVFFVF